MDLSSFTSSSVSLIIYFLGLAIEITAVSFIIPKNSCNFQNYLTKYQYVSTLGTSDEFFPALNADIDRLNQILSIFIDNAINYSLPKSEISLDATVFKNTLVFSIKDHGTGIADKDKPFIFDRFFCADKSRTQKEHYGLGLSIAKELVEMHKGKIELSDTLGGGCTFKIFLPL